MDKSNHCCVCYKEFTDLGAIEELEITIGDYHKCKVPVCIYCMGLSYGEGCK